MVFKPIFRKIGDITFYILTLGVKKTRDAVYLEAAKNHQEQGGIFIARHSSMMIVGFLTAISVSILYGIYGESSNPSRGEKCIPAMTSEEFRECRIRIHEMRREKLLPMIPFFIFFSVIAFYNALRMLQVYRITTDFKQYLSICKPHMGVDEVLSLESSFALMKNKEDYKLLTETLNEIAVNNGKYLPRYQ